MTIHQTQSNFVELDRTFHELSQNDLEADEIRIRRSLNLESSIRWKDVLNHYRVILISEAGAGKTTELRTVAETLKDKGKAAFFLRLEYISDDFESAFVVGTASELQAWIESTDEGWLFLDSVDEAKLRHPRDFERAIRSIGARIKIALQRARVFISSRPEGWRPVSDLKLYIENLSFAPKTAQIASRAGDAEPDQLDTDFETTDKAGSQEPSPFKVLALDDLGEEQVETFIRWKGVQDAKALLDAIQRANAWEFTGRPQDLEELIDYWTEHKRIGSRLDVMQTSIDRRLRERDQSRDDSRPISNVCAREGTRLLAAAATMARESSIRVPDGTEASKGIVATDLLRDWKSVEVSALLSRPVFDEGIYGSVRFHHRSVREYLTAEWLSELLRREASRRGIESLLFRNQYGIDVVVPSMRPILHWLVLLDKKVCVRLASIEPEVLLEDGDPSKLPLEVRRQILHRVCDQLSTGATSKVYSSYNAVERFADKGLADDVKALLIKHSTNDDVVWFLLRMAWQGELQDVLSEVKSLALSASAKYTRIAAYRALRAIGSDDDMHDVRVHFLKEGKQLNRAWLAELLDELTPNGESIDWCIKCIGKTKERNHGDYDELTNKLDEFFQKADDAFLSQIIDNLYDFLDRPPYVETRHCEISQKFSWLLKPAAHAVKRLIERRDANALANSALGLLSKIAASQNARFDDFDDADFGFPEIVPKWNELNRKLFWHEVENTEQTSSDAGKDLPTEFWNVRFSFWQFDAEDLDYFLQQIIEQKQLNRKHLALSLAFRLYVRDGRSRKQRERLKGIVAAQKKEILSRKLSERLNPPPQPSPSIKQMQTRLKRRNEKLERKRAENLAEWTKHLRAHIARLRNDGLKRGQVSSEQEYVHEVARSKYRNLSQWTNGDWRCVAAEFGEDIAKAYRDGVVAFWRDYRPNLRSEGAPENQTPFAVIFGLTGILIDARETSDWIKSLSSSEAELACRYASYELNGFPVWFPGLFKAHPSIVTTFLLKEIDYELSTEKKEAESNYILSDLSWSGKWAWDEIAPALLSRIKSQEPKNFSSLKNLVRVVNGSSLSDEEIQKVASAKCKKVKDPRHFALWLAVWVGVDPSCAIDALEGHLKKISKSKQTEFVMQFLTLLVGSGRESSLARVAFKAPAQLKRLYLIMLEHVRVSEDIDRRGKGAYSPGIRDEAQRARDSLVEMIRSIPGKESFVALSELADSYPDEQHRPWFAQLAKLRAEADADFEPWSPAQVREFHDGLERTPRNHRELAELMHLRLLDLRDDIENGDASIAKTLMRVEMETEMRNFIGRELREKAQGRYSIPQEEELADAKRIDLRIHGAGFDGPVPCELKLSQCWTVGQLFERLENQLCGDYLRDNRSSHGFFLIVHQGKRSYWTLPNTRKRVDFPGLIEALTSHWESIALNYPNIEQIEVIGIDLTKRIKQEATSKPNSKRRTSNSARKGTKVPRKSRRP